MAGKKRRKSLKAGICLALLLALLLALPLAWEFHGAGSLREPGAEAHAGGGNSSVPQATARSAHGQAATVQGSDAYFRLLSASPQETLVRFCPGELSILPETLDGRQYSAVSMKGGSTLQQAGKPALPIYRTELAVPSCGYRLELREVRKHHVICAPPLPSSGPLLNGEEAPQPVPDADIYGSGVYPEEYLAFGGEYHLRSVSARGLMVTPCRYDFTRGIMTVVDSLDFALVAEDARSVEYAYEDSEVNFKVLESQLLLNSSLLQASRTEMGKLLVIVPDDWSEAVAGFAEYKRNLGFQVEVAAYPSDTGSKPLDYIKGRYQDNGTSYLILCGDCTDVPPAYLSPEHDSPGDPSADVMAHLCTSDVWYALVDGDDYVPDMFVSRVPAHDAAQLKSVLGKLMAYESEPPDDDGWRGKGMFFGSSSYSANKSYPYYGEKDYEITDGNYHLLMSDGAVDEDSLSLTGAITLAQVKEGMNNGPKFLYYLGHGSSTAFRTTGFSSTDAKAMTNGGKLPFVVAPVCNCGNFAYKCNETKPTDCLGEAFLLGDNPGENGAVGVMMGTGQTFWTPPIKTIYAFTDLLRDAYNTSRLTSFGAYNMSAVTIGAQMAEANSGLAYAYYYATQMHLFGDCTMLPRLRKLRDLTLDYAVEDRQMRVSLVWQDDGKPVPNAYVTFKVDGKVQHAVSGEDGRVAFELEAEDCPVFFIAVNDASTRPLKKCVGKVLDANGDGHISNEELLAYLAQCRNTGWQDVSPEMAIAAWEKDGANEGTRNGEDSPCPAVHSRTCTARLNFSERSELHLLRNYDVDIVEIEGRTAVINGTEEALAALKAAGFVLDEVMQDAEPEQSRGNIYLAPDEVNQSMEAMAMKYPQLCTVDYVGQSAEKRDMLALRIGTNAPGLPNLLLVGGIHGNERPAMMLPLRLARYLLEERQTLLEKAVVWIVPMLNPDGCSQVIRSNAAGVDLNRSFPDGALNDIGSFAEGDALGTTGRQPETQAFMRWAAAHNFNAALAFHTGSCLVCYPYGNYKSNVNEKISPDNDLFIHLAQAYADNNSAIDTVINSVDFYPVVGELPDWMYRYLGVLSLTVELGKFQGNYKECQSQEELEQVYAQNIPAFVAWTEACATGVFVNAQADGQGLSGVMVDAGYGIQIPCDNLGRGFRILQPGTYDVSVSAIGYNSATVKDLVVKAGQAVCREFALEASGEVTMALAGERLRSLPSLENHWCLTTASPVQNSEEIITVAGALGGNYTSVLGGMATASRLNADASRSYLFASRNVQLDFSVDGVEAEDAGLELCLQWNGGELSRTWRFIPAEVRYHDLELQGGWNLYGLPMLYADISPLPEAWVWKDGKYIQASAPLLGQGVWIYAGTPDTISLKAYYTTESLKNCGWNIISSPVFRQAEKNEYILQEDSFRRADSLPPFTPFWHYFCPTAE